MLLQVKISNFLSFRDEQLFSMVASNRLHELPANKTGIAEGFEILKTASLFGANSSGKSNLFKAINFMQKFVLFSFRDSDEDIEDNYFALNPKYETEPSLFEIVFFKDEKLVRYGFTIKEKKISSEWLFIDEEKIFQVEVNKLIFADDKFLESNETKTKWKIKNNKTLFLTLLSKTETSFVDFIMDFFRSDINVMECLGKHSANFTKKLVSENNHLVEVITTLLKEADLHINQLQTKKIDFSIKNIDKDKLPEFLLQQLELDSTLLLTEHNLYDDEGNIIGTVTFNSEEQESSGTNEILRIAGPIADTLNTGGTLLLDEVDAQLHPMMTDYILSLFNSDKNQKHAQLIITSHNPKILNSSILRRDQIWFVEKDITEASHLTALSNYRFKGEVVRKDENYEKNYLDGKYGAIPLINENLL